MILMKVKHSLQDSTLELALEYLLVSKVLAPDSDLDCYMHVAKLNV